MSERMCVCGHKESEHEKIAARPAGPAVCFHDDDPDDATSLVCPCMEFKEAEAAAAAGE